MSIVYHREMVSYQDLLEKIGKDIRIERTRKGLSQEKFAEIAGVHTNYIGKIERGEQNLTIKKLVEILNSLDLNINFVLK